MEVLWDYWKATPKVLVTESLKVGQWVCCWATERAHQMAKILAVWSVCWKVSREVVKLVGS